MIGVNTDSLQSTVLTPPPPWFIYAMSVVYSFLKVGV